MFNEITVKIYSTYLDTLFYRLYYYNYNNIIKNNDTFEINLHIVSLQMNIILRRLISV